MLLMFYLAEYLHLVIASIHFTIFFIGGWQSLKFFWFLPAIFLTPHDVHYWTF
jgi:NADH:ubiquinone oxidoreductase subunit H